MNIESPIINCLIVQRTSTLTLSLQLDVLNIRGGTLLCQFILITNLHIFCSFYLFA